MGEKGASRESLPWEKGYWPSSQFREHQVLSAPCFLEVDLGEKWARCSICRKVHWGDACREAWVPYLEEKMFRIQLVLLVPKTAMQWCSKHIIQGSGLSSCTVFHQQYNIHSTLLNFPLETSAWILCVFAVVQNVKQRTSSQNVLWNSFSSEFIKQPRGLYQILCFLPNVQKAATHKCVIFMLVLPTGQQRQLYLHFPVYWWQGAQLKLLSSPITVHGGGLHIKEVFVLEFWFPLWEEGISAGWIKLGNSIFFCTWVWWKYYFSFHIAMMGVVVSLTFRTSVRHL